MTQGRGGAHTKDFGAVPAEGHTLSCPRCGGSGRVEPDSISIGDRFRACRVGLNKTQSEIAPDLRISRAQLANIEADRSRPGLEMLVLAAEVFGVSTDYLLGRKLQ